MKAKFRKALAALWRRPVFNQDTDSPSDRYRGLRGVVRHIRTVKRARAAVSSLGSRPGEKRNWGVCKWCGLPIQEGRRLWHFACTGYYYAFWAQPSGRGAIPTGEMVDVDTPYGRTIQRPTCPACGEAGLTHFELDHILAIGVARRLGLRFYRRAYLPENLWWICERCHKAKTAFDRALMRSLDNPTTPEEERQPTMKPAPLFEWRETLGK